MATNFRFGYNGSNVDFDDYYIRLELFATGNLWGWGRNAVGQLGDNTTAHKSSPVQTHAFGLNWKEIAAGNYHSMALKNDGTLWGYGENSSGQLGVGDNTDKNLPTQLNSTDWKKIACGGNTSASIKTDGTLWCWGSNASGAVGNNSATASFNTPQQNALGGNNWQKLGVGYNFAVAIKNNGSLYSWGDNSFGQLGDGLTANKSTPAQVGTDTTWDSVSCGYYHAAAIKTDGTLWCWGLNNLGQLGDNSVTNRSSPVQTKAVGTNWKNVKCGFQFTAAVKTDGTLWTWGENDSGQLGTNDVVHRSSPIQTKASGTTWKNLAGGRSFMIATKTDGSLWAWGSNSYGNLAKDDTVDRNSPIQINKVDVFWKNVACGFEHALATHYLDTP